MFRSTFLGGGDAYMHTRKPRKLTKSHKKSGKNRERHLKKKARNIRTVPMRTCVHVHTLKEITVLDQEGKVGS